MTDQRSYQRSPIELAASFGIPDDLPYTQEATVVNISSGGFGFFTHEPIKPNKEVLLAVDLENGEIATLKVKTVWAKAVGDTGRFMVGVQVIEAEGNDFEKFLDFYTKLAKTNTKDISS